MGQRGSFVNKTILLTRPRAASERLALCLRKEGFVCLIDPLLRIEPTGVLCPVGGFQAVVITSANALEVLVMRDNVARLLSLPCYCVGATTGAAAKAAGFTEIYCGAADSIALAQKIAATQKDKTKPLLHIAGETVSEGARKILEKSGFALTVWAVYRAQLVEDFSEETKTAFINKEIDVLPVFSRRSAHALVTIIEKNQLIEACSGIRIVGLSQAVADVLQTLPWRRVCVAAKPDEESVFACLQQEIP